MTFPVTIQKVGFALLLILLNLIDLLTTVVFLGVDPTLEANPLGAWLYASMGVAGLLLGKIAGTAFVLTCVFAMQKYVTQVVIIITVIMSFVVINNTILVLRLLGVM